MRSAVNDSNPSLAHAMHRSASSATRPRLLIVEDERDLRELLAYNLSREGFRTADVATGEGALDHVAADPPDMILLDLMLPGMSGLEVCRRLKADRELAGIAVVMLSAKGEEADIVTGLEMGADDYITKPFSPRVLAARLKAVLRRVNSETDEAEVGKPVVINGLTVDPQRHEVRIDDRRIDLTAMEFKLLSLLTNRPGRVYTRQQIIEQIHGRDANVTDRSVDVQVVMLRRKLEDRGAEIETVRGVGYRFRD